MNSVHLNLKIKAYTMLKLDFVAYQCVCVCVQTQAKDLESVCMIGTQCRCVGSRCHLEKAEFAGGGKKEGWWW